MSDIDVAADIAAKAEARREAEELRILLKVRALLATAESSEFEPERQMFAKKALAMADEYQIEPELLDFPKESLKVAVVMAELRRVKDVLIQYEEHPDDWPEKSVEWGEILIEFDGILEMACEVLDMPLKRLPYGCVRHFRPVERDHIEQTLWERVAPGENGKYVSIRDKRAAPRGSSAN